MAQVTRAPASRPSLQALSATSNIPTGRPRTIPTTSKPDTDLPTTAQRTPWTLAFTKTGARTFSLGRTGGSTDTPTSPSLRSRRGWPTRSCPTTADLLGTTTMGRTCESKHSPSSVRFAPYHSLTVHFTAPTLQTTRSLSRRCQASRVTSRIPSSPPRRLKVASSGRETRGASASPRREHL